MPNNKFKAQGANRTIADEYYNKCQQGSQSIRKTTKPGQKASASGIGSYKRPENKKQDLQPEYLAIPKIGNCVPNASKKRVPKNAIIIPVCALIPAFATLLFGLVVEVGCFVQAIQTGNIQWYIALLGATTTNYNVSLQYIAYFHRFWL